jgi:hypothetical protein
MQVRKESKQDLAKTLHPKYRKAIKAIRAHKSKLFNAFVEVTGYHRNYAKKLLLHGPPVPTGRRDPLTGNRKHAVGFEEAALYGVRSVTSS